MEYIMAITACPKDEAYVLAKTLVQERVCACANVISGVDSIYHWKGKVEESGESMILMKTEKSKEEALWKALRHYHSYEVPEFTVFQISSGSQEYLQWITDSLSSERDR
ncbi:MAG: divalent-cation tolerance protein CutA [Candidatus Hodarchaeota archaeon]